MRLQTNFKLLLCLLLTLVFIAPDVQSRDSQDANQSTVRPLNMLVLGDSIMWGEGLKAENKFSHRIKTWLTQTTGRQVIERIEAHAGAVIEEANADETRPADDGEVNVAVPTVNHQLESAVRHYGNGSQVDLVLVSGCGNDVDVKNILNAAKTTEEIRLLTEVKCGKPMERLLRRISASFPAAYIIVAGYYPFASDETNNDIFMRGLTKRFHKAIAGASRLNQEAILRRVIDNSQQWYLSSNKSLSEAVRTVNAEVGRNSSRGRIMFAEIHVLPEHAFRARKTQQWNFESSPIRKLLVILSFGKILLRPNDQVRKQRSSSCKKYWKAVPAETESQKKERKNQQLLCRYAALGHPNRQGALTYAEAITEQLKSVSPVWASR
jgi:lysophospholipase L1-like esterase